MSSTASAPAWIERRGVTTVAAEADWPAAYRVNRYVRDFTRCPHWMWRAADVPDFVTWLRSRSGDFWLDLRGREVAGPPSTERRPCFIGVIRAPQTERSSHPVPPASHRPGGMSAGR